MFPGDLQPGEQRAAAAAHPGLTPDPASKASFSLASQWGNCCSTLAHFFPIMFLGSQSRAPPGLSCCFFYPKPFLCLTVPRFSKRALRITWTHPVKSFLHEVRSPHTTAGLRQPCSELGPCLAIKHQTFIKQVVPILCTFSLWSECDINIINAKP